MVFGLCYGDHRDHDDGAAGERRHRAEARRRILQLMGLILFRAQAAQLGAQAQALLWPLEDSPAVPCRRKRAVEARAELPPLPAFSCAVSTFRSSIYACRACNITGHLWAIAVDRAANKLNARWRSDTKG